VDLASDFVGRARLVTELTRYRCFEASHRYWRDDWSQAENVARFGRCTSPFGHGHNYTIAVTVRGAIDATSGMVVNLRDLDELIAKLVEPLDHQFLNRSVSCFRDGTQPTAEALGRYCSRELRASFRAHFPEASAAVSHVAVQEGETLQGWCAVNDGETLRWDVSTGRDVPPERLREGGSVRRGESLADSSRPDWVNPEDVMPETLGLTRTYTFSAAHRLHEPSLSDDENQSRFGKCNNPHGHGHDYRLDVTVSGALDPETSMVVDLACLDETVQAAVLERLDHRHLNYEVPPFDRLNPTSENVLQVIWGWLAPVCPACLFELALWETPRNRFTLRREEA
jgi:6-pyruvoyltetrahydropterin/6-carboxytetrahydropterin synthase